ncbi:MAG: DUF3326 domain-containing protein [Planctomycetota bacterium]|jgi:hypothetical protein
MVLIEHEVDLKRDTGDGLSIEWFEQKVLDALGPDELPIRFAITESTKAKYHCELGILARTGLLPAVGPDSIFEFRKRRFENTDRFNAVLLVPTGIGAEIGGHAGDAGPVARLMAASCDTLITHPNVVNASDINELPENGLYVEGSVISSLLMGTVGLLPVRANRVLLVIDRHKDKPIADATINAASAARASLGLECPLVVELEPPIKMRARYSSTGCAVGRVEGLERLCETLEKHEGEYDAVALTSVIDVPSEFHTEYFRQHGSMVNPWGGVEAMLTHAVTMLFGIPAAHSPMFESTEVANLNVGIVDPRMSAEAISVCFLHCILKGLHRSPRIITDVEGLGNSGVLTVSDVSCLVIPEGCVGLPTLAALEQGIPVIAVKENKNRMRNDLRELPFDRGKLFVVENYLEAVGIMSTLKSGVTVDSVRRPIPDTTVRTECIPASKSEDKAAGVPESTRKLIVEK